MRLLFGLFQVEKWCKAYLIQCATAESVLRLDKTMLKNESQQIQQIYIAEQHHENLQEYIEAQLQPPVAKSILMQVIEFLCSS